MKRKVIYFYIKEKSLPGDIVLLIVDYRARKILFK
jgi:hypothetical protein